MQYGKSYIKGKKTQHSMAFNSSDFAKVQTTHSHDVGWCINKISGGIFLFY